MLSFHQVLNWQNALPDICFLSTRYPHLPQKVYLANAFHSCSSDGDLIRRYTNEQLVVPLPNGVTACDIGSLTVWCRPFRATFSRITIPRSIFVRAVHHGIHSACESVSLCLGKWRSRSMCTCGECASWQSRASSTNIVCT
jgi:hypothetical protein